MTNLVFSLGAMQLAKRLPLEDNDFIQKLRVGYVAAQVLSLAIYLFISYKVRQSRLQRICVLPKSLMSAMRVAD